MSGPQGSKILYCPFISKYVTGPRIIKKHDKHMSEPLRKKLKSETQIRDKRKDGHLRSEKMRRVRISEDRNWLGGG
jgi:hypothetical protein